MPLESSSSELYSDPTGEKSIAGVEVPELKIGASLCDEKSTI